MGENSVQLTIGITSAQGYDFIVPNDDLPLSLLDLEASEDAIILLAVHERPGAVHAHRTGRHVCQITALTKSGHHVQ
jgi:hypothetical protein